MEVEEPSLKRIRKRESCLLVVAIVLGIVTVILAAVLLMRACKIRKESCTTKACTLTANNLIMSMDLNSDPCKDFYKFACGGFIRRNLVPEDQFSITHFELYSEQKKLKLRNLLETEYSEIQEPSVVFRVQEAYNVCLHINVNKDKELQAFRNFINDTLEEWPLELTSEWEANTSLEEYLGKLRRLGLKNYLFDIFMSLDGEVEEKYMVFISAPVPWDPFPFNPPLPDEADHGDENNDDDIKFIKKYFKVFGGGKLNDNDLKELVSFKREISQIPINITDVEEFISKRKTLTIHEFNNTVPEKIDWLKLLNNAFLGSYNFSLNDTMQVMHLNYLKSVVDVLNKHPERTVRNFINLGNIKRMVRSIDSIMEEVNIIDSKSNARWKVCLEWIEETFPLIITRLFVNKYVNRNGKAIANDLIKAVQDAYKDMIRDSNWVDQITKERALYKANAMRRYVAYPDLIFDKEQLEEEYLHLNFVYSSHVENVIHMRALVTQKNQKMLNYPIDHDRWTFYPLAMDAYYNFLSNSIMIPLGVLQLPFFEVDRLAAVNFGMVGSVVGHEIGHGFDSRGSRFDEFGRRRQWWEETTKQKYDQRITCFQHQYSQYCPKELQAGENETTVCVDGKRTLAENIADNTGIRAAYKAYQSWIARYGSEMRLPGLEEYSPEQIFFISYGNMWCANVLIDKWVALYGNGFHAANHYRVIGSLSNFKVFADAFHCPVGQMKRGDASCNLW